LIISPLLFSLFHIDIAFASAAIIDYAAADISIIFHYCHYFDIADAYYIFSLLMPLLRHDID
jgi:hypothetical protein